MSTPSITESGPRPAQTSSGARVGLAVSLGFGGNARRAIRDLRLGRAQEWHQALQQRFETAYAAAEEGPVDLIVPRAPAPPGAIQAFQEIHGDPSTYRNRQYADYFGLGSIRIESSWAGPEPSDPRD